MLETIEDYNVKKDIYYIYNTYNTVTLYHRKYLGRVAVTMFVGSRWINIVEYKGLICLLRILKWNYT